MTTKKQFTPELREQLKAKAQEKRLRNPKAKDYEVADWLMALDWVLENESSLVNVQPDYFTRGSHPGRVLKYVGDEVVSALCAHLPAVLVRYRSGPGTTRETCVFPNNVIVHVLSKLKLEIYTYSRQWSEVSIRRCRK